MNVIEQQTLEAVRSAARKYTAEQINWEQRCYEVAKDIYVALITKPNSLSANEAANLAVKSAQEFINVLK